VTAPKLWIPGEADGETRRHAPATLRNRVAIADMLRQTLPPAGIVLEVASGSGEHAAYFAQEFPALRWQPSDPDADARRSITAWCEGIDNVLSPLALDAAASAWRITRADAVLCINMVHISPWDATLGLLSGAAGLLPAGGALILYGPFVQADVPTAPSNLAFDETLKARDSRWGLRSVEAVASAATLFTLEQCAPMPANNLLLVFRRR
jgi:hypothetical protein